MRDRLEANVHRFRNGMTSAGFDLAGSTDHAIVVYFEEGVVEL